MVQAFILFIIAIIQINNCQQIDKQSQNLQSDSMMTILIYGEGTNQDLQSNIGSALLQNYPNYEILVAVSSQQTIDQIQQYVEQNYTQQKHIKIKYIAHIEANDFVGIIKDFIDQINGEFIVLSHILTQSKPERLQIVSQMAKSQNFQALLSDISIYENEGGWFPTCNRGLIQREYKRGLDYLLFTKYPKFEFQMILRKSYFQIISQHSKHLNRFDFLNSMISIQEPIEINHYLVNISVSNYRYKYTSDYILISQKDRIKFQHYNRYLQSKYQQKVNKYPSQYPLVSIAMASYNRDHLLIQAVNSIIEQTYTNWELHIVDDGSHNLLTLQILQFLQSIPRIRVSYLYTNQQCTFAHNYAISYIKGEFFTVFDDDDIMLSDRIEKQLNYLIYNKELDLVGAKNQEYDPAGTYTWAQNRNLLNYWDVKISLATQNIFTHGTVLVRMSDKMKKHFYYEHTSQSDYRQWLKLLYELEHENIKMGFYDAQVQGVRSHFKKLSHYHKIANDHKSTWIPVKQLEAFQKLSPSLLDHTDFQCLSQTMNDIINKRMPIRTCEGFNIENVQELILSHYGTKPSQTPQDLIVLTDTLKSYVEFYNQAQIKGQVQIKPDSKKRIFACIYFDQKTDIIQNQIEQLKGHVDQFIILSMASLTQEKSQSSKQFQQQIKQIIENKYKTKVIDVNVDQNKLLEDQLIKRLKELGAQDDDYVLILSQGEFINTQELKKFEKLRMHVGVFGLRQLNETQHFKKGKIINFRLLKEKGFRWIRNFEIAPEIHKNMDGQSACLEQSKIGQQELISSQKFDTIQHDTGFVNVNTIHNGGYILETMSKQMWNSLP
ncbi:UNKNOWN [Stylonychia lemnae]|uniref:Glycosyltransferase 2-like domain-containing protein n=1 Tax=Stylonychia lemnae TaxID=5949 RepID=A0A077ZYX4_STYLE|nr:UNKNOWN [Stylonychia lemnae]|eukprot:CDW74812.1 UNKNOWN [Stylonychia lemnae]